MPTNPTMIGPYRLGRQLGCGAQGEVYAAIDTRTGREVAIKLLYAGRRSRSEIKAYSLLDHPNIVLLYEAGEHDGDAYLTMKLMVDSLASPAQLCRYHADPVAAVELVETIARAVHYLHQRGILHRDLKPANILLDAAGVPYVADFGVAKHIDDSDHGTISGTRRYMAPEQLDGHATVYCDIYALGVLLYEVLTGRRPFESDDIAALIHDIRTCPPPDPRRLRPDLHVDLARICLRCLEKRPEDRHASAEALAEALRRHLNGELPEGASRPLRAWRWCTRHAQAAALLISVFTFLVVMIPRTFSLMHAHEAAKREQLVATSMHSAKITAGMALLQLKVLGEVVERSAREAMLGRAVSGGDTVAQQGLCEVFYDSLDDSLDHLRLSEDSPFDAWFILDDSGVLVAQFGMSDVHTLGEDYAWRDYFEGAWALARANKDTAYVSQVFRSENDGLHKFAISTPIYAEGNVDSRPVGVLVAAVGTAAGLGSLALDSPQGTIALAAPRDEERGGRQEDSYLLLLHSEYTYGEADAVTSLQVALLERISRGEARIERPLDLPAPGLVAWSDDYRDPAAGSHAKFARRWLAAFAPVGHTGLVVIVQTPYDVLEDEAKFGRQLMLSALGSLVPGVLVMFAVWYERRRRARPVVSTGRIRRESRSG